MSLESNRNSTQENIVYEFQTIAKEIVGFVGKLLSTRPYVAIVDFMGNIWFTDAPLEQFIEFIQNFVMANFNLLQIGEHSLPLGGINLAFFKVSPKAMIVLYTIKGLTGQLLSFKSQMFHWSERIEALLAHFVIEAPTDLTSRTAESTSYTSEPTEQETQTAQTPLMERGTRSVPVLTKELSGKEKFSIDVVQVLQLCDGNHSVSQIAEETGYPLLKINDIIRNYQKKKWITLKRLVS